MDRPLIYIAAPYSHPSELEREQRAILADNALAELLRAGVLAYSPISHTHAVADLLPETWEFWRGPSLGMLSRCDCLVVLMLDGFSLSVGMREEIKYAHERGMPCVYWHRDLLSAEKLAEALNRVSRRVGEMDQLN